MKWKVYTLASYLNLIIHPHLEIMYTLYQILWNCVVDGCGDIAHHIIGQNWFTVNKHCDVAYTSRAN